MLGRIVGLFGVRGELKVAPSAIGESAIRGGLNVILRFDDGRSTRTLRVSTMRPHNRRLLVRFDELASADDAEVVVGAQLWAGRENAPLAQDEYFDEDLIGCRLVQEGRTIGEVRAVLHYPAQDLLELASGALVPLVRAFVREIDVAARIIRVELPEGLVEGEPL
jgi:16S rRNA processing protein RimM